MFRHIKHISNAYCQFGPVTLDKLNKSIMTKNNFKITTKKQVLLLFEQNGIPSDGKKMSALVDYFCNINEKHNINNTILSDDEFLQLLQKVSGIKKLGFAIQAYLLYEGPIDSIDQLKIIKYIGPKRITTLKKYFYCNNHCNQINILNNNESEDDGYISDYE